MPQRQIQFLNGTVMFLFTALAPAIASAQTTTTGQTISVVTNSQSTQLVDQSHNVINRSYIPDHPFWVNRNECLSGAQYQIGISSTGINGLPFEVWATNGGDCSTVAARFPPNPTCWKVYAQSSFVQGTSGTTTLYIDAQTILGGHKYYNTTDTISIIPGTTDDCEPTKRADTVPSTGVALTLYFFAFGNGSSGTPTATTTWNDVGYDLIGPSAPSSVGVSAADTQLYVSWSQVLDSDLAGYHIYCETPKVVDAGVDTSASGGSAATGGSSATSATGGSSSGGSSATGGAAAVAQTTPVANPACADSRIMKGKLPDPDISYRGRADGVTPTSGIATGLENGKSYACAVSAFDTRQNDGLFSQVQCGTPWWVNDFYTVYRDNHGKGGGGFCSIGQRASGFGLLIPLASVCLLALRRARIRPSRHRDHRMNSKI